MTVYPAGLDATAVDALQTDRYLDALLCAVDRRADDVPADPAVNPTLRLAARRLRDELVRTYPSFRFEERLAHRLADAATAMRLATMAGGESEAAIIRFPAPLRAEATLDNERANRELAGIAAASADVTLSPSRPAVARPLLVGGALTSAALSLAGAAFVAWRLTRGAPADPLARVAGAVRSARAAREAALAMATPATAATATADAALGQRRLA